MVQKKKKYWETPELIAVRAEAVRLHTTQKYTTVKIGSELGKSPTQIWRWLKGAGVFQPISPKELGEKIRLKHAARKSERIKRMQETAELRRIERLSRIFICKECGNKFRPTSKIQQFCGSFCRTKNYLCSNRDLLAQKAKKKSELLHKSRAQNLYATTNPKCGLCHRSIPFAKFLRNCRGNYCSHKCSQKARSERRKNDPIKAAAFKETKRKTYLKRQRNGKNRSEKRRYYRNNIQARIAKNLRARLYLAVRKQGGKKSDSTMSLTAADWPTFKTWIENKFQVGMTWENYGLWHIDHETACCRFDLTIPDQQRECFHYKNLQPLWGIENIKKGSKIIPKQTALIFDR